MKKIIKLVSFFVCIGITTVAQIPNNGFENWTNMGTYDDPDNWSTLNSLTSATGVFTCTKGTPGNTGDSYLHLESKNVSGMGVLPGIAVSGTMDMVTWTPKTGFAFTGRPQRLTGTWQYMGSGADPGFIAVYLTKWDAALKKRDTVAEVKHTLIDMAMIWAPFSIDLNYLSASVPDSALIVLAASGPAPVEMSYLYIDNLSFAGGTNGIAVTDNLVSSFLLYPNPVVDELIIELSVKQAANLQLQVADMTGKLITVIDAGRIRGYHKHLISTSEMANGIYFLKVIVDDVVEVRKIVIH